MINKDFGTSACDVTGSFPSPLTIGKSEGRSTPIIGCVYAGESNITIKHNYFAAISRYPNSGGQSSGKVSVRD